MNFCKTKKNGFTIIEVVFLVFILMTTALSFFTLLERVAKGMSLSQSKLTAYYLVQEGIESVRNIRDTSWLKDEDMDEIFQVCTLNGCEVAYNEFIEEYDGRFLKIDGNGFYGYPEETEEITSFKRKILIDNSNEDYLEVKAIVLWSEWGEEYQVEAINRLYHWYR